MPDARTWRSEAIAALTADRFDVLVVGGGIVGAGIAREAAFRRLGTALVDRHDFAEGTSSRSSRLLHGGLRYLAQGRLGLVRESSVEKRTLQKIAPHLAQPLAFVFPTYKDRPDWKRWKLAIGVKIYDALCGWKNFGASSKLSPSEVEKNIPGIRSEALTGGVRYFDGFTSDARLVIDTLRSAQKLGATLCNRMKLQHAKREGDAWRCELLDQETLHTHVARAKYVLAACGPWADSLPNSKIPLRLTKGVHLVVPRDKLPVDEALVMTEGKRILFAIPWGERTILGTTDTDYVGLPEDVACESQDIDYILAIANTYFPGRKLKHSDIRATWAGIRPLVSDGASHPSDTSRSHVIRESAENWIEIAGGKLTTYRLMAEQAIHRLGGLIRKRTDRSTATVPLLEPSETAGISGVTPPAVSQAAVKHYCENEWALHVADVMQRRAGWQYYADDPVKTACDVAKWMGELLGWDPPRIVQEGAAKKN